MVVLKYFIGGQTTGIFCIYALKPRKKHKINLSFCAFVTKCYYKQRGLVLNDAVFRLSFFPIIMQIHKFSKYIDNIKHFVLLVCS